MLIWANGIYAGLSGKGEILPEAGFIRVQGRVISLQGIQVIAYEALCKDKKGEWACGKTAWEVFGEKLATAPTHCMIFVNLSWTEGAPENASCWVNGENLNSWLVRQGWALGKKGSENHFHGQEKLAKNEQAGLWRGGFIPPDEWKMDKLMIPDSCGACTLRHQSFQRTRNSLKEMEKPEKSRD
ncbi:MAG: thermonuclease family protein [Candidatus Marinimicrobia bacterium]|nr:thermonuclease family protein [Candidatus Neomarinimicrobiota bacterium]